MQEQVCREAGGLVGGSGEGRRTWGTDYLGPCRPYLVRLRLLEGFQ